LYDEKTKNKEIEYLASRSGKQHKTYLTNSDEDDKPETNGAMSAKPNWKTGPVNGPSKSYVHCKVEQYLSQKDYHYNGVNQVSSKIKDHVVKKRCDHESDGNFEIIKYCGFNFDIEKEKHTDIDVENIAG
jgi:hypothetical protein